MKATLKSLAAGSTLLMLLAVPSVRAQAAPGPQPHMDAAYAALQQARQELQQAEPNKGGHREKAIELVDHALQQVRKGIEFANVH